MAHVWSSRSEPGAMPFLLLGFAAGWWLITQFVILIVADPPTKLFVSQLQWVGIAAVPVMWFAFVLVYTGRGQYLWSWPLAVIYGIAATTVLLVFTNDRHGLIWRSVEVLDLGGFRAISVDHGEWFRVHLGASYSLVAFATGLLGLHLAQSPRHWGKLVWVIGAPLVVLAGSLLYLTPLQPEGWVDLTPTAMGIATAMLGWGLMNKGSLEMAPVARTIVVEEMGDVVIVVDSKLQIVDVNRSARETLGLRVKGPVPIELGAEWASARARTKDSDAPERIRLETVEKGWRDFEMRVGALGPQAGRGRSVVVLRDVTERIRIEEELREMTRKLEAANRELKRRANTDGLTGLANRRYFTEILDREIERADRYGRPLSLILLDLDHFKDVNDTYGHAAGDLVLKAAAAALNRVSRETDLPARVGGEELAILLPETHLGGAAQVAERLRTLIAAERHFAPHATEFSVTASFGVATRTRKDGDGHDLMQWADEALYEAKAKGRDRVVAKGSPGEDEAALLD